MFERLSEGFSTALRRLSGKGAITEDNVREAMGDIRDALLEADVHYDVVKQFTDEAMRDAVGREVTKSLEPGQEMIGVVHDRLVAMMSPADGSEPGVPRASPSPTVVMMCGLQGSGKTTTCGKLAAYLKKRGRSVMLAAADLQRPAAVDQLRIVAEQVRDEMPGGATVRFYAEPDKVAAYGKAVGVAVDVCKRAYAEAQKQGVDVLILDTAGRLHVNDELMQELERVNTALKPHQVLLVVDAMTGQDAINSAKAFHERLAIDGVILTKFDSDTRGGAAISVKHVTGAPIRFIGVGEKLDALEEFHAPRIAGRILGMGDVVSLVEKARDQVSDEDAERMAEKMAKGQLTMDDFLGQLRSLRKMGPMKQLLGMLPGVGSAIKDVNIDDKQLDRVEGIVNSMTAQERKHANLVNNSRRRRIAHGSGVGTTEVSQLLKQFDAVSKLSKQMSGMGMMGQMKAMRNLEQAGAGAMNNTQLPDMSGLRTRGSTHTVSPKKRFKQRKKR
ncbi:MAG: signal recognition particle protein [Phycisphaerales bacterium]|nr:MAG: signal recognition particle protein [Phycisphaerales bacterium]